MLGGGTTRVVQYGAIDHVLSYNLSCGVVSFFPNCTTRVVPPLALASICILEGRSECVTTPIISPDQAQRLERRESCVEREEKRI